jgi:hypothetical protein
MPLSIAATAADTDASYAHIKIVGGVLRCLFRSDASSSTAANRRVDYDFSVSDETTGLPGLFRKPGLPWGWSTLLYQTLSVLGSGRRTDGLHVYGWSDANAGTGAGRIDEIDTGTTDNGTAIASSVCTPWERAGTTNQISGQEIDYEHSSPVGSTGTLVYHRMPGDDAYSMTPGTSSAPMSTEKKMLTMKARAADDACFVEYSQATGSARELRRLELTLKVLPTYKPS